MHAAERHATRVAALAVALLTALGVALRVAVASDSLMADELSTYWIISDNGLADVISTVHTNAEITPPLHFVAAWLTTRIDLTPELARAPSLLAGAATIPAIYLLGLRTVGRAAALMAAAIASLAPFMIFYSAEARSYALMMLLVTLSTLTMLIAVDVRRARWWAIYSVCSCAAVYTHYTAVFALGAQLLWLLWAHPEARRAGMLASAVAAVGFLPWLSGLRADLDSPTTEILSALSPFDWIHVRAALTHAAVGYPYSSVSLRALPGVPALILLALAVATGLAGLALAAVAAGPRAWLARADPRVLLILALALSVPVAEALVSAVGTNLFSARNLAAAWPAFALALGALVTGAGPRLRLVAAPLAIAGLAIGAAKMLDDGYSRPKFDEVAEFIESRAEPGDVVVDGAVLSPGPVAPLEVAFREPHRVVRFRAPVQRERPFGVFDRAIPDEEVVPRAVAAAGQGRVFVVSVRGHQGPDTTRFPARYRVAESRTYPGTDDLSVQVWTDR